MCFGMITAGLGPQGFVFRSSPLDIFARRPPVTAGFFMRREKPKKRCAWDV